MKSGIHPQYNEVLFYDHSVDFGIVTRSTIQTKKKMKNLKNLNFLKDNSLFRGA